MIILPEFSDDYPFSNEALNVALSALASAINAQAGAAVVHYGTPVDSALGYMPKTGGTFVGTISAPAINIGENPALSTATPAAGAVRGAVFAAAFVSAITASVSNPPTQSEVTAIKTAVNDMLAALKAAGIMLSS